MRKTCSIASANRASARLVSRHLAGLVTSGQLCPDLRTCTAGIIRCHPRQIGYRLKWGDQGGLGG